MIGFHERLIGIVALLWSLAASTAWATCADLSDTVSSAVAGRDGAQLERLLERLQGEADCSRDYLESVRTSLAQLLASQADRLAEQGRLREAEALLDRAPFQVWPVLAVRGDIAAQRKQWGQAAKNYGLAYEIATDPQQTPKPPPDAILREIFSLAAETQILAGDLSYSVSRSGKPRGIFVNRGPRPVYTPIPVQFEFDKADFSPQGVESAQALARYLRAQHFQRITLIGHTDPRGAEDYNQRLSEQRAAALSHYLEKQGVTARIDTLGKGESEPPRSRCVPAALGGKSDVSF